MNIHLPSRVRWVTTLGGPLLRLPETALKSWTGIEPTRQPVSEGVSFRWRGDPDGPVTDYDRACSVDGFIGLVDVGDAKGLVLGDEPNSTTWVPVDGGGLLVRLVYWESEEDPLRFLRSLSDADFRPAVLSLSVPSGPLLLFDSACAGGDVTREEALAIPLVPGSYEVSTEDYRPNPQTSLLIHRLRLL